MIGSVQTIAGALAVLVLGACRVSPPVDGAAAAQTGSTTAEDESGQTADETSTSTSAAPGDSTGDAGAGNTESGDTSTGSDPPQCSADNAIPVGSSVVVDGVFDPGEWDDAGQFSVMPGAAWTASVGIKHDTQALAIAFAQFQPSRGPPAVVFPEILIDVGNRKAEVLGPDDWWFHVSLTDCAASGAFDVYDDCVPEAEDWEANNFPNGQIIDAVEIRIPFATLGLDPGTDTEIGVALRLSDTQGFAAHWPAEADPSAPVTWATLQICASL